ncbi:stalk domain-containing protein [Paenibacillus lignilyticus]|uniref:Ankyrin repeat domain-containing protein n=1 Tax=Paenibacillus lignilyticus TaxID=1172615 RepID=A0ABS5CI58_9BACL|nr:stalk domain-containing protein [Paenibacillus lignilyticus]MBP3965567.1 ankyrin repeat domain-containing protein [Paenibacillus lignilyticus]
MKTLEKLIFACIALLLLGAGMSHTTVSAAAGTTVKEFPYTLSINGKKVDFAASSQPLIMNGTALVPFRPIFEQLGLTITWKSAEKRIIGESNQLDLAMTLGSKKATVNGKIMDMPAAPSSINGTTYVPLRFIGEASGGELQLYGAEGGHNAWFLSKKQLDLFHAVAGEDMSAVEKLLQQGADPTIGVGPLGPTVAAFAPFNSDNVEMLALFLKYGMDINYAEPFIGTTILHNAVSDGRYNMVKFLLENGADPTLQSRLGTPLEIAQRGSMALSDDFTITYNVDDAMITLLTSYIENYETK